MSEHDWEIGLGANKRCRRCGLFWSDFYPSVPGPCAAPIPVNDGVGEGMGTLRNVVRYLQSDDWKRETADRALWFDQLCDDIANDRVSHVPTDMMQVDALWQAEKARRARRDESINRWFAEHRETPAEGATAPKPDMGLPMSPAKPSNKPAQSVPSIGHALRQVNRPTELVGLANRFMGGRG